MNVWMRAIIAGTWGVSETKYLCWVSKEAAWHYVAQGWADYA